MPYENIFESNSDYYNSTPLSDAILDNVMEGCLFYPCSGDDLRPALDHFFHRISDFYFVDHSYFRPGDQNTRNYKMDLPADEVKPLYEDVPGYCYMGSHINGEPSSARNDYYSDPCQLTEIYLCLRSGSTIRIHRIRDNALNALERITQPISIFFYRGDSLGEGGSGDLWLSGRKLDNVINKMINGGIIVTDGSNVGQCHDTYYGLKNNNPKFENVIYGPDGQQLKFIQKFDSKTKTNVWLLNKDEKQTCASSSVSNPIKFNYYYLIDNALPKPSIDDNAQEQMRLGVALILQRGATSQDKKDGLTLLIKAAEQGYLQAIRVIAFIYEHGTFYGLPSDKIEALPYWMRLADLGNMEDQYRCFCLLRNDLFAVIGEEWEYEKATEWANFRSQKIDDYCRGAISQGHKDALLDLNYFKKNGIWPEIKKQYTRVCL